MVVGRFVDVFWLPGATDKIASAMLSAIAQRFACFQDMSSRLWKTEEAILKVTMVSERNTLPCKR